MIMGTDGKKFSVLARPTRRSLGGHCGRTIDRRHIFKDRFSIFGKLVF